MIYQRKTQQRVKAFKFGLAEVPSWYWKAVEDGVVFDNPAKPGSVILRTRHGDQYVNPGDWLILFEDRSFGVMSDRWFNETYEVV